MTVHDEPAAGDLNRLAMRGPDFERQDGLRQRAIEQMLVLDSPSEERFDRLTRLAQNVFGVPMSAITLLDKERVWRKSCAGVSVRESPRSDSFCGATVALERMVIVEDAREDPRFSGLRPVMGEPGVRFYAGYPLRDPNGIVVGTFCLFDVEPRTLGSSQQDLLAELAGWAQQELADSVDTRRAREVQQQLLPTSTPQFSGYDVAAICVPAHMVGGDFYDYALFGERFGFCVADVMGKGTAAAILTATVRAALRGAARRISEAPRADAASTAAAVLMSTSRAVHRDLEKTGALVTVFTASIDKASGAITYADAGHGLTVLARLGGDVRWLASCDLPLGVAGDSVWTDRHATLAPGDTLLCFSDGLLELFGGTDEALDEITQLVLCNPDPSQLTAQVSELTTRRLLADDVTALAIRRRLLT